MAIDSQGNDLRAVGVPVTGFIAIMVDKGDGTLVPVTPQAGAVRSFQLPAGMRKAGLITDDGGFEWDTKAGDRIEFWQSGYYLPSGGGEATLKLTLAENNEVTDLVRTGTVRDANNYLVVSADGAAITFYVFTEELFKNGVIRRRHAFMSPTSAKEAKSKRGDVQGLEVELSAQVRAELNNGHYGEWRIAAMSAVPVVATLTSAAPSGAAAGQTVTVAGTGFTGATATKFGATAATSFQVVTDTQLTAVVPAGAAGSAPITVTTAAGVSSALAYTRGA